jgi:S-(hydroxymethyl)glutathione dehydrogenase/alcohol dehydrogenase
VRAAVLSAAGAPLGIEDIPRPAPKAGEILVRVAACGVCHSDLHVARGHLPFPLPCVLGHEISGVVDTLGPGVSGPPPGARVVASFIMPCGRCRSCEAGRDDLCETYFAMNRGKGVLYDGTSRLRRADGTPLAMQMMAGLADYAVVPATDVFPLPESVPLEDACVLGCAIMTAYGALKNAAQLRPGESIAVVGAGGVGSNLIQLARVFGAGEIVAVDVTDAKLEEARKLGATSVVNAARNESAGPVDVAVEAVGRPETIDRALKMTRDGGRVVLVGVATAGQTAAIEINRVVRRGLSIRGSFGCRVRADMPELLRLAGSGKVKPGASITRRVKLEEINEVYGAMERGEILGRAIVVM